MPYLNLDLNFYENPKFLKLEASLGNGTSILAIRLWAYAGKHCAKDGLIKLSSEMIEKLIGWWGEKNKAIEALQAINFIEKNGEGYHIHDWEDHQGHIWRLAERNRLNGSKRWRTLAHASGKPVAHASGKPVGRVSTGKERKGKEGKGKEGKGKVC